MKLNKKFIAIPAIALAAGLSLAACGNQSAPSHAAPAATDQAAPAPKPTPTVDYKAQYLADVAPFNAAIDGVNKDQNATATAPDVIALEAAGKALGRKLLTQTWPANAQADRQPHRSAEGIPGLGVLHGPCFGPDWYRHHRPVATQEK
jgi:hypothetical protein